VTALLALWLLSAGPDAAFVSPWAKVRPGASVPGSPAARLSLLRGECEGFQLQVHEGLELVSAEAPPLVPTG